MRNGNVGGYFGHVLGSSRGNRVLEIRNMARGRRELRLAVSPKNVGKTIGIAVYSRDILKTRCRYRERMVALWKLIEVSYITENLPSAV